MQTMSTEEVIFGFFSPDGSTGQDSGQNVTGLVPALILGFGH